MPRSIRRVVVAALLLLVPSISSAQIGGQGSIRFLNILNTLNVLTMERVCTGHCS